MEGLRNLWKEETGQGMTEYGLIIGVVSVLLITVLVAFKDKLVIIFEKITTSTSV